MTGISRIFIANRGEIAVRLIRACQSLGLETVLGVSEADKESLSARMADRAICIGPPRPAESYLKIGAVVAAARGTGCQALHSGYGFLAENPELAEACERNRLIFIGPSAKSIRQMGNKLQAREIALECRIPVIPGSEKNLKDAETARESAEKIGYPVMVKAAAGGGGRGMKVVRSPAELASAIQVAGAESTEAFGDGTLYLERYIPNARHIEVQIAADRKGNVIHVGERDCSLQRRHQKMVEEAPASSVPEEIRKAIQEAAVALAERIGYENLGTVEFIFDQDRGKFYFLEMNTRIQVEHPVTEMISGIDLVQEQIRIAGQSPLSISQSDLRLQGHAIECRITAESPRNGFSPCPGRITHWSPPLGPGIRLDTHCYPGYFVPPYYDSLLGKVICWGADRGEAMDRMVYALDNFQVSGIDTNIPLLREILRDSCYREGRLNTTWVEQWLARQQGLKGLG